MKKKLSAIIKLFKRESIFSKVVIYYSAALLILCIINIAFYCIIKNTVFDKEISKGENYLRYLSVIMDQKLTEVHNLSYSFLTNKDNIERMANVDSIQNQYRINAELNHIAASIEVSDRIFLYNPYKNTVCSDDGVYSAGRYMCETYGWSADANTKLNEALNNDKGFFIMPASYFSEEIDDALPFSMIVVTSEIAFNNAFRLVIPINDDRYSRIVMNDVENVGAVCIVNHDGDILFSSQKNCEIKDMMDIIRDNNLKRGSVIEGDNIVLWDNSNYFKGNYIKLIPKSTVSKSVRGVSICLFLECAALVLFGIIIVPFFLRLSYMPVYNILGYYKSLFGDESEVKNEYTYIVDGLGRLKSELNEYNGTMLLFNFLQNGYFCEEIYSLFSKEFFAVAIVKMRDKALMEAVSSYIKNNGENIKFIGMSEYQYAVIINSDSAEEDSYCRWLDAMMQYAEEQTGERILVAVSDVLPGSEKIKLLYRRAEVAYNHGCCADVGKIFVYTDSDSGKHGKLYYPDGMEENIIYAVKNGLHEDTKKLITEIFDKNSNIDYSLLEVLNMRCLNLYFKLSASGGGENVSGMTAFFNREYELDKVREYIIEIFSSLVPETQLLEMPSAKIQDFLINYINERYSSPSLNIDMIAEQLKLSVPYTSRIFKQATGQTFKEYLLNKRIEEAKLLLKTTDFSIKEISGMVGAGTYNSFVRMFKNKVGVSPGQYRSINKR